MNNLHFVWRWGMYEADGYTYVLSIIREQRGREREREGESIVY